MNRIVRHFATRLKRAAIPARSATASYTASAWERFDHWLAQEPIVDATAAFEFAMVREDARLTIALIGQAGEKLVDRISEARASLRLPNDSAAQFALALAVEHGNPGTRAAASMELAALS